MAGDRPHAWAGGVSSRRRLVGLAGCLLGLPALTAVLVPLRDRLSLQSALLIYLLAVVLIAVAGGIGASLVAALLSFLLANFFFTTPYYTFVVADEDQVIELVVFVIVATLVSVSVDIGARNRVSAERNRMEASLLSARARQLAETDRVRSALLAAVGHDLRTPLAGIKASVSSLRQTDLTWTPEEQQELLEGIEESTDRLGEVIGNLLAMSRIQAGAVSVRITPVSVDEVVAAALLGLGEGAERVDVPEDLPAVLADAGLLERVVANLVANARHFSPAGAPAAIEAKPSGADAVVLRVVDHGPGVPSERWEEMFSPFQRLGDRDPTSGLGMGLAIVRGLAEPMNIAITPSQTPGGGLTMSLRLPVAP